MDEPRTRLGRHSTASEVMPLRVVSPPELDAEVEGTSLAFNALPVVVEVPTNDVVSIWSAIIIADDTRPDARFECRCCMANVAARARGGKDVLVAQRVVGHEHLWVDSN